MAVQLIKNKVTKRKFIHPKRGKTMPPKMPRVDIKKKER